jgi:hypothetical protein
VATAAENRVTFARRRGGSFIRLRGPLGARASSTRRVQRGNDRLALGADNVGRIVIILIIRFHHVEDHRLRLIAGGAPNSGESL